SPPRIIASIWNYFVMQMKIGLVHHDELDAHDPLTTLIARGWCDCVTGSALFAGLARARGIPARLVTGAVLYRIAPGEHTWLEVLLPPLGWLPVDIFGAFLAARASDDPGWNGCFLGHLDPRLVMERLPGVFVGAVGVKVPRSWYLVQTLCDGGVEISLGCLDERGWALRDAIRVSAQEATQGTVPPPTRNVG